MTRTIITMCTAIAIALVAATGGIAAQRYLITSPDQIKPGAIGYGNLSPTAQRRIAHAGRRGLRGLRGPAGPHGLRGATGATGARGAVGPEGPSSANGLAQASGLIAWTSDPALITTSIVDSSGSIHGASVWLNKGSTISWLAELVAAHGSGMAHGAYAIYDSGFRLVARTPDTPNAFDTAKTDSWVKLSLTGPYVVPASGRYYFVDLLAGSTIPKIGIVGSSAALLTGANVLPGGVPRGVGGGTGFSTFPATLVNKGSGLTRCILAG